MKLLDHPIHTALVHFPLAFWTLASFCDGLALFGFVEAWKAAAALMGLGVIMGLLAMIPGLIDLAKLPPNAQKTGIAHMTFMGAAWLFYLLALILHLDQGAIAAHPNIAAAGLGFSGFVCLVIGGFYGGELVFRHGAGQINN